MRYKRTKSFKKDYRHLPADIQEKAKKAFDLFRENQRHPSLKTHKIEGTSNPEKFEGYIDGSYRFTFHYEDDVIVFRRIGPHSIIEEEARG